MEGCELGCGKQFQENLMGVSTGHCLVTEFPAAWVVSPSLKHSLIPETYYHDFQWGRLYSNFPNKNEYILKVWKTSKAYDWNQFIEYTTNIFFSDILLKFSTAMWPSVFKFDGNNFSQNLGLLCPSGHLTFSMLDCVDHFFLWGTMNFIFPSFFQTSRANYPNKFH